jgi:hypothetical protein
MRDFGGLAHIKHEVQRVQADMDAMFGVVNPEDWK